jgi:alkaline phosphatase
MMAVSYWKVAMKQLKKSFLALLLLPIVLSLLGGEGCRQIEPLAQQGNGAGDPAAAPITGNPGSPVSSDSAHKDRFDADSDDSITSYDVEGSDSDLLAAIPSRKRPKNFIFFIGDGMGINHVNAASLYAYGVPGDLVFQAFDVQGMMMTHSADSDVTDSAASATAMASGRKVDNGVIGVAIPGDGSELPNMTDFFKACGKSVGLVTTTTITHATPAGFGAHTTSRDNTSEIASDYLVQSRPNLLFGGGGSGITSKNTSEAGYTVIKTLVGADFAAFAFEGIHLAGLFGTGFLPYEFDGLPAEIPHLWEMSEAAITVLLGDPDGFFLMVEGGRIDHAGHRNDLERLLPETLAFEKSVADAVLDDRLSDTLMLVTADHATGGLIIDANNGAGEMPDAHFTTGSHTGENVPIYVMGSGSQVFAAVLEDQGGVIDNTDIYRIITELIGW